MLNDCRITKHAVFIGDQKLPDYIADNGVTVIPGGHKKINTVRIDFIVGEVVVEDASQPDKPRDGEQ